MTVNFDTDVFRLRFNVQSIVFKSETNPDKMIAFPLWWRQGKDTNKTGHQKFMLQIFFINICRCLVAFITQI